MDEGGIEYEFEQGETLAQLEQKAQQRARAGWSAAGPASEVSVKLTPDIFTTRYSQTFKRAARAPREPRPDAEQ